MAYRRHDKNGRSLAVQLRASGHRLSDIAKKLGIAKSTASRWRREIKGEWSPKRVLTNESRKRLSEAGKRGNLNRRYKLKDISDLKSMTKVRERIFRTRKRECEKCGWREVNEFSGIVPVQCHHKDGNPQNNRQGNIEILCPNCHSLTDGFMFYGKSDKGTFGKKGTKRLR